MMKAAKLRHSLLAFDWYRCRNLITDIVFLNMTYRSNCQIITIISSEPVARYFPSPLDHFTQRTAPISWRCFQSQQDQHLAERTSSHALRAKLMYCCKMLTVVEGHCAEMSLWVYILIFVCIQDWGQVPYFDLSIYGPLYPRGNALLAFLFFNMSTTSTIYHQRQFCQHTLCSCD